MDLIDRVRIVYFCTDGDVKPFDLTEEIKQELPFPIFTQFPVSSAFVSPHHHDSMNAFARIFEAVIKEIK